MVSRQIMIALEPTRDIRFLTFRSKPQTCAIDLGRRIAFFRCALFLTDRHHEFGLLSRQFTQVGLSAAFSNRGDIASRLRCNALLDGAWPHGQATIARRTGRSTGKNQSAATVARWTVLVSPPFPTAGHAVGEETKKGRLQEESSFLWAARADYSTVAVDFLSALQKRLILVMSVSL
jgi:hypothetical protein